jgi:hypothetical protein
MEGKVPRSVARGHGMLSVALLLSVISVTIGLWDFSQVIYERGSSGELTGGIVKMCVIGSGPWPSTSRHRCPSSSASR